MNICQICIADGWGGAETVVYELARQLRNKGESVSIILNHEIKKYYADLDDVNLFDIGCLYPPDSILNHIPLNREKTGFLNRPIRLGYRYIDEIFRYRALRKNYGIIKQFLRKNRFDIVHSHLAYAVILVSMHGDIGVPILVSLHGESSFRGVAPDHLLVKPIVKWQAKKFKKSISKADRVMGVSQFLVDAWNTQGVHFKKELAMIHNGINIREICINMPSIPQPNGNFSLFFPGGEKWYKGGDLLVEALSIVKPIIPNIHLDIALDVPENSKLRRLVKRLGLESNVTFLGFLSKDTYRKMLNSTDVFVLPSRLEPFGITLVEAMALGKPVISSITGGIPEVIQQSKNGILVEPCAEQLADAILYLYNHPEIREEMSRNNIKDVQRFNWEHITDQYIDLYREMLGSK